jgi:hypothetical protein
MEIMDVVDLLAADRCKLQRKASEIGSDRAGNATKGGFEDFV